MKCRQTQQYGRTRPHLGFAMFEPLQSAQCMLNSLS